MTRPAPLRPRPDVRPLGRGRSRRLRVDGLDSIPDLAHAFGLRGSAPESVLSAALPGRPPLRLLRQVHGSVVREAVGGGVREAAGGSPPEGDALVTDRSDVAIGVTVADCAPILVCDPERRAIGAVHAGWRGTVAGVLEAALETIRRRYGSAPSDLRLAIGPAIGPCCFEVGDDVIDALLARDPGNSECIATRDRRRFVDLVAANRRQALAAGIPPGRIGSVGLCTACHPGLFCSYRRDRAAAGRMLAVIGWTG
jgi:YfiH family protein